MIYDYFLNYSYEANNQLMEKIFDSLAGALTRSLIIDQAIKYRPNNPNSAV